MFLRLTFCGRKLCFACNEKPLNLVDSITPVFYRTFGKSCETFDFDSVDCRVCSEEVVEKRFLPAYLGVLGVYRRYSRSDSVSQAVEIFLDVSGITVYLSGCRVLIFGYTEFAGYFVAQAPTAVNYAGQRLELLRKIR